MQPKISYGGVPYENEEQFYNRTSHRLRHKDRALTHWDYEQLVLDRFSDVQIVKCTNKNDKYIVESGKMNLFVISKDWSVYNFGLFSGEALLDIKAYLKVRATPFIDIEIKNPTFEYLLINCSLKLENSRNSGQSIAYINDVINDFLTPYNQVLNEHGGLGGSIVPISIMSRLEKLDFVRSVIALNVEHIIKINDQTYSLGIHRDDQKINAASPGSVLVPYAEHNIDVIGTDLINGIGNFEVGKDLIIATDSPLGLLEGTIQTRGTDDNWWLKAEDTNESSESGEKRGPVSFEIKHIKQ